jgi:glutamine synthetase
MPVNWWARRRRRLFQREDRIAMVEQVRTLLAEKNIGFLLCSFVEITGAPKAKLVPLAHLESVAAEGAGFAGFACGDIGQGWDPYANDHEDANCQFEINWGYAEAMTTADRHTFFKWMVRSVAEQHGLCATFMPKPFAELTGNGAHYHMSLADTGTKKNLFRDDAAEFGLSQLGRWFMGGILHHARGLAAVIAPLVNSYKRLIRGAPRSGATWAPVYVTYGPSNRTQMIRLPGPGRIENRAVDGAANPYLACAAMLAAGLDGIERQIGPGPPNRANLYEVPEEELRRRKIDFLPTTLAEALDALAADEVVQEALGTEYARYYLGVKRKEWLEYHRSVSPWELERYLKTY